ncbi:hypothetical protein HH607_005170 [Escherichia coli]|nr:hypothetical protein [Escherichia coli]
MCLLANDSNFRFHETFSYVIRQNGCQFVYGWQSRKRRERLRYDAIRLNGVSIE